MALQQIHELNKNMTFFIKAFAGEDDFVVVLATFCFYCCGVNGSESVEKIDTDQKDYHKSSLDVITNHP